MPSEAAKRVELGRLLRPGSIAIVGASAREGSFGQRLLNSITTGRYTGKVYPINPRYPELGGLRCYPDLASLPEVPDLACFAVSDDVIEAALSEAAGAGVKAAAMFGRAYEPAVVGKPSKPERLGAIAREAGMAVCGNNCMGFVNFIDGLKISGNPPPLPPKGGVVGLVSHSGSTWSGLVGNQRQLDFNYAISAGQEIATTVADYIRFLLDQPETRVIGCLLETVRDPEGFLEAIELADARGIPVVVLKLGRSERGRALALAHSGALAGSDAAYGAVFERRNVVRVMTPDELTDTLEMFSTSRRPTAAGLGIVTDSGGERELIVDVASDIDAPIATVSDATRQKLVAILDPGMEPVNPVDSYGDGRMLLGECMQALAEDDDVGIVALATNLVHGRPYLYGSTAALEKVHNATAKPTLVFGNIHSTVSREEAARLRSLGIPVLMGTVTALSAMKHFSAWHQRRIERARLPENGERSPEAGGAALAALSSLAGKSGAAIEPADAYALLAAFGVPTAKSAFVASRAEAIAAAGRLGFPVALKTAAADILHKTDQGGVVLGLADAESVGKAYDAIRAGCGPSVQVQRQVAPGVEIILGMTSEPPFGPMMTIGLGGILTEILADAVTVEPPVTAGQAQELLRRLKGHRLLEGYRGRPAAEVASLAEAIARFSVLCAASRGRLAAIDINPIIAGPDGAVAVDALMIKAE